MKKQLPKKTAEKTVQTAAAHNHKVAQTKQGISLEDNRPKTVIQQQKNNTGLPNNLKSGIESLSGHSMDDVKVHYNSSKPAQLNAHAYAQGTNIHVASGQEKHLPHEAWHVVQQKQGRVQATKTVNGAKINDNAGLEKEADVMGAKALQRKAVSNTETAQLASSSDVIQKMDKHYWVVKAGHKKYIGSFKNHKTANNWWAKNKSNYKGYTFGQGSSSKKYR
ncbi:DUF4157 domain-containing protein [uncultured Kordia sp.]|uniref:eCIS core domain-containing protein n=1 Tax=uncultured Kordia sp. TaxID=507699 RepID=UPI0026351098|nr:DUF4157 domain-containing protein [uncultured Kordia sp.]